MNGRMGFLVCFFLGMAGMPLPSHGEAESDIVVGSICHMTKNTRSGGKSADFLPPGLRNQSDILEENGRWDKVYYEGGYRWFWRPTTAGPGWSPSADETSAEPFGNFTHHHGNWIYDGNYWYWAPPGQLKKLSSSQLEFSQANYEVNEDGSVIGVAVTVIRGDTEGAANVDIRLADKTATGGSAPLVWPEDYDNMAIAVIFPDTVGSQTVVIPISDDNMNEQDEIVNLTLANPVNDVIGTLNTATLVILDNDAPPAIFIDDPAAADEGADAIVFTVSLDSVSGQNIRVTYQTNNGTATAGSDYTGVGATVLTIPAGNSNGAIVVDITEDTSDEANETFTVDMSQPVNATILNSQATGTITDNDAPPATDISDPDNTPSPTPIEADAGTVRTVDPGTTIILVGPDLADSDLSYSWSQLSGTAVTLSDENDAQPAFTAPSVETEALEFQVTVEDISGNQAVMKTIVNVSAAGLVEPIADAGRDLTVMTGETVTLDGFGSRDPDGNIASYFWEQVGGDSMLTRPAQGSTNFFATETGSFTLMLTVTDNDGLKAMDTCAVLILAAGGAENLPPGKPVILTPLNENRFVRGADIDMSASPFSDPNIGDSHMKTTWIVRAYGTDSWCAGGNDFRHTVVIGDLTKYALSGLSPGMKYDCIVGYTDSGSGKTSWSDPVCFKVGSSIAMKFHVDPGQTGADFPMVSFHVWPDNPSAPAVFGPIIGEYSRKNYLIGTYDPIIGGYLEYGPALTIEPGRAYWVFAFDGIDDQIQGVPVTVTDDVELTLKYNPNARDGWNMIACPNNRNYYWEDLIIKKTGPNCKYLLEPIRIGDLSDNNPYINKQLWQWVNGDNSETGTLEYGKGYWILALTDNLMLVFPHSASWIQSAPGTDGNARESAIARRKPPSPPVTNTGGETDSGGGCFLSTVGR